MFVSCVGIVGLFLYTTESVQIVSEIVIKWTCNCMVTYKHNVVIQRVRLDIKLDRHNIFFEGITILGVWGGVNIVYGS